MRVRMNYTVMRSTVAALPEIMRLAQRLRVQLYLNLATDHTFLFRDGQVSIEARVDQAQVDAALAEVEQVLRADRRFLPRYSELAYLRGHFADLLQKPLPCAESQLKLMVHSTGEVGGCWGHDATANVRDHAAARRSCRRPALPGGARAVLPQGVRGLRQQLRAQPGLAAADVRRPTCCGGPAGGRWPAVAA